MVSGRDRIGDELTPQREPAPRGHYLMALVALALAVLGGAGLAAIAKYGLPWR